MPMQVATNLIARLGEWDVSITTEPFPFQVIQKHQQIGIKLFLKGLFHEMNIFSEDLLH